MQKFLYRVIGVFTKYNNKWFLNKAQVTVKNKGDAGAVVLLVTMLMMDPVTRNYVIHLPSQAQFPDEVFRRVDAYAVRNTIVGKLNLRPQ